MIGTRSLGYLVLGAGALAAYGAIRRATQYSFTGKVVVICGGSRGLGLVIARQLAAEGASLALLARDPDELERAREDILSRGGDARTYVCDISRRDEVDWAIGSAVDDYGRIDVLINNAGVIQVAPFDNLAERDFDHAMAVHFYGPLYTMQAVLPHMRRQGGGRILNVSSIGGRIGVPHLAPYCASKFALVGLSQSLAAELRRESIRVTVVCPGLMRTGSHGAAMFRGQHDKEFAWFAAMDSVPLLSVRAARAARIIIESCREGQALVTFPWHWRVADIGAQVLPNLTAFANGVFARFLPGPAENGGPLLPGRKSRTGRLRSWLTRLADRAARENNEQDSLPAPG